MAKFGIWRILGIGLIGSLAVVATSLMMMGFSTSNSTPPQYCRTIASQVGVPDPTPNLECFATQEEVMLNTVLLSNAQHTRDTFAQIFKGWTPPEYTDKDKAYCAFMLTDLAARTFKAACADSVTELGAITKNW